jgi:SET domain-containing protein
MAHDQLAVEGKSGKLTAFVREVLMPGGPDAVPNIVPEHCRFPMHYAESSIHRLGVFADSEIPPRRRVIEYTGLKVGPEQVRRRMIRQNLYIFTISKKVAVDGATGGSGAEYINHSCEPNLWAKVTRGHIWLISLRRIAKGEELLLDYRIRGDYRLVKCRCGAPNCRGYLNLPEEQDRAD